MKRIHCSAGRAALVLLVSFAATSAVNAQSDSKAATASSSTPTTPINVNVVNTPTVNIGAPVSLAGTPNVNIANAPSVTLSGSPTVQVGNTLATPVPVQFAIPTQPFFQDIPGFYQGGGEQHVAGPGTGKLAITSITATNASGASATFELAPVVLSGGSPGTCNGTFLSKDPGLIFFVPAGSTTQLTFPSPLVIGPSSAQQTCFVVNAIITGSAARLDVVGFVQ